MDVTTLSLDDGSIRECRVAVCSMRVPGTLRNWREQYERKRGCLSVEEAAQRLDDQELAEFGDKLRLKIFRKPVAAISMLPDTSMPRCEANAGKNMAAACKHVSRLLRHIGIADMASFAACFHEDKQLATMSFSAFRHFPEYPVR